MKKNIINKKYKELFYRFSENEDFEEMIEKIRGKFSVDTKKPELFLKRKFTKKEGELWENAIYDILFKIIPPYMENEGDFLFSAIENYVIEGKSGLEDYLNSKNLFYLYGVKIFNATESKKHILNFYRRYENGVFVYIPKYATKNILIEVVNKKWKEIEKMLNSRISNHNNQLKKLRSRPKRFRDQLIENIYSKSRKELGLKQGEYKEIKVANILKTKYGIIITPEAVKMVAFRKKQKSNFNRLP